MIKRLRKGFTLVELVIVIAVIAVLAAVLIPTFSDIIEKANNSADLQEARNLFSQALIEEPTITEGTVYVQVGETEDEKYVIFTDGAPVDNNKDGNYTNDMEEGIVLVPYKDLNKIYVDENRENNDGPGTGDPDQPGNDNPGDNTEVTVCQHTFEEGTCLLCNASHYICTYGLCVEDNANKYYTSEQLTGFSVPGANMFFCPDCNSDKTYTSGCLTICEGCLICTPSLAETTHYNCENCDYEADLTQTELLELLMPGTVDIYLCPECGGKIVEGTEENENGSGTPDNATVITNANDLQEALNNPSVSYIYITESISVDTTTPYEITSNLTIDLNNKELSVSGANDQDLFIVKNSANLIIKNGTFNKETSSGTTSSFVVTENGTAESPTTVIFEDIILNITAKTNNSSSGQAFVAKINSNSHVLFEDSDITVNFTGVKGATENVTAVLFRPSSTNSKFEMDGGSITINNNGQVPSQTSQYDKVYFTRVSTNTSDNLIKVSNAQILLNNNVSTNNTFFYTNNSNMTLELENTEFVLQETMYSLNMSKTLSSSNLSDLDNSVFQFCIKSEVD